MLHSENCKHCREKCGISREAYESRRDFLRPAQAIDSMLQPVLGDVSINKGIRGYCRKAKNEQKAQGNRRQRRPKKETEMVAHQLAHATNIPQRHWRFVPVSHLGSRAVTRSIWFDPLRCAA